MAQVMSGLQRNLRLLAMMRQMPFSELKGKVGARVKAKIKHHFPGVSRRNLQNAKLRAMDQYYGPERGNQFFWKSRAVQDWSISEARLFQLQSLEDPSLIASFVKEALLHSIGGVTVMMLARSGLSRDSLAQYLRDPEMLAAIARRIPQNLNFGTGVLAAAALLLEPADLARVEAVLATDEMRLALRHDVLLDSFAFVPTQNPSTLFGTVASAPSRQPARHRLIVADTLESPTRLSLLFAGAETVSLLSPSNLFGKANFGSETPLHARPNDIRITHPRSRITRFSSAYHNLHDETRQVAEELLNELDAALDGELAEAKPYLAMHFADALFFQGLRISAIEEFLGAEDVDQVMIVSGDQPTDEFFSLLAGVRGLLDDPRVEIVSLARSEGARMRSGRNLGELLPAEHGVGRKTIKAAVRPLSELVPVLRNMALQGMPALRPWPLRTDRKARVMFFTTPYSTYNTPTSTYIDILARNFDMMIGVVGTNVQALFGNTPHLPIPPAERVQLLPTTPRNSTTSIDQAIEALLEDKIQSLCDQNRAPIARHVIATKMQILIKQTIMPSLFHWERLLTWFGELQTAGTRPDLLVISPLRPSLVGLSAAAARRFGIPSFAIEPHIINAEYCRYTRVMTDHYGTVSPFLAALAEKGFSIPQDRISIIGSPRLIATPAASPQAARESLETQGLADFPPGKLTLAFFSQPSKWEQISEVWRIILSAMAPLPQLQILLKVHPEEGDPRIADYLSIAQEMGLSDRVQSVKAAPGEVIEAADLVFACYSTTIVEAALAGRPVFSITNGATVYPMSQHEVVGAPQYHDTAGLAEALRAFQADPAAFSSRVAAFMEQNQQFVTGPEPNLIAAINALVTKDPAQVLRPAADLPPRLFIEGPYRVYDI